MSLIEIALLLGRVQLMAAAIGVALGVMTLIIAVQDRRVADTPRRRWSGTDNVIRFAGNAWMLGIVIFATRVRLKLPLGSVIGERDAFILAAGYAIGALLFVLGMLRYLIGRVRFADVPGGDGQTAPQKLHSDTGETYVREGQG